MTLDTTDFSTPAINTGTGNFKISLQNADITEIGGNPTKPTSSVTSLTSIPEAPASAIKILSAATNAGEGSYNFEPLFSLLVPGETDAGSGTATITLTAVTGP